MSDSSRIMEPQKIREGYLVKKVRDKTVLIERWSPLCFYIVKLYWVLVAHGVMGLNQLGKSGHSLLLQHDSLLDYQ